MSSCRRSLGLSKIFDVKDKEGDCRSRRQQGLPGCAGAFLRFRTLAVTKNSGFHSADWGRLTRDTLIFVEEVLFSNEVEVVSLFLHSSYLMMGEDGHRSAKLPTVPALLWLVLLAVSEKYNS